MRIPVVQCASCAHFVADVRDRNVCTAFPEGIPQAIIDGEADHREPYQGDRGVRYQAVPGYHLTQGRA